MANSIVLRDSVQNSFSVTMDANAQTSITPVCDMGETCDMSQDYRPITKFYMP